MGRKERAERLCLPTPLPLHSHRLSSRAGKACKDRHRHGAKPRLTSGCCWHRVRIWMGFLSCFLFFTWSEQHASKGV